MEPLSSFWSDPLPASPSSAAKTRIAKRSGLSSFWSDTPDSTTDDGSNSSPPMDRPGDEDYAPPPAAPSSRPHRDMSQFGASLKAAGAEPAVGRVETPSTLSQFFGVAGNTLGGTAKMVPELLGRGASSAEKTLGGGVRAAGQGLRALGGQAGPLKPLLDVPGAALEGLGSEAEYMGGRQAEETSRRLASTPGSESIPAKIVEGVPMMTGFAAAGPLSATAAMGTMGAGAGLQEAEQAGATPAQAATASTLQALTDAAMGQLGTIPVVRDLLHGIPVKGVSDALLTIAKKGGMGALQAVGQDLAHGLSRYMTYAHSTGISAKEVAKNAAAQALLQGAFDIPAMEMEGRGIPRSPGTPEVPVISEPIKASDLPDWGTPSPKEVPIERRVDLATRKRVNEMSPEEMARELHTSDATGLPGNLRAYKDAGGEEPNRPQAAIDLNGLKWTNDNFGHETGTQLITTLHRVMHDTGIDGYHLHGDEFAILGDSPEDVASQVDMLRQQLEQNGHIEWRSEDGTQSAKIPIRFGVGIGEGSAAADKALYQNKAEGRAAGTLAARGDAPGAVGENTPGGRPSAPGGTEASSPPPENSPTAARSERLLADQGADADHVVTIWRDEHGNEVPVSVPRRVIEHMRRGGHVEVVNAAHESSRTTDEAPIEVSPPTTSNQETSGERGELQTSLKNSVVAQERTARGLPEVEMEARKSNSQLWDEARQRVAEDPSAPQALARSIIDKPRPVSELENNILLHDRMRISLDHRDALAAEEGALASGDESALAEARAKRAVAESQMDTNDQAARLTGREMGHAFRARQMLIREDYSPVNLIRRYKVASGGRKVPPEVSDRIVVLARELVAAQDALDNSEGTSSDREAERLVAREKRSRVRGVDRQALDREYADLSAEWKKATEGVAHSFPSGREAELSTIIARMAANRVRAGANSLGEVVDSLFSDVGPSLPSLERSDIRDAIAGVYREPPARVSDLQERLNRVRTQARLVNRLDELNSGQQRVSTQPRGEHPDIAALRNRLSETEAMLGNRPTRSDAARLRSTRNRLLRQIRQAEAGVARSRPPRIPDTPEISRLRERLRNVLEENGLSPRQARSLTDAQRLSALRRRLERSEATLTRQIETGDFSAPSRRPPVTDPEVEAARARVRRLRLQVDRMIREQELNNRTKFTKTLDMIVKYGRFNKLTSLGTGIKIPAAGITRTFLLRPMEEILGYGIGKVTPSKLALHSPIEAAPSLSGSARAIARSWAEFFSKPTWADALGHLKMQEDELSLADLGAEGGDETLRMAEPQSKIDYPAHFHAFLKIPTKRAAYAYAMEKQAQWLIAHGADITDPILQLDSQQKAVAYANRGDLDNSELADAFRNDAFKRRARELAKKDIYLNDNEAIKRYRAATATRGNESLPMKITLATANSLLPIVKVPMNFTWESTDYAFGLPKGGTRLAAAIMKGLDELPPNEGDRINRQLKKGAAGALGAALLAAGVIKVGGFYSKERKGRGLNGLEPGDISVGGIRLPRVGLHSSIFPVLQVIGEIGAARNKLSGLYTSARGVAEEVPFYEESHKRIGEGPNETQRFAGDWLRGMTIPPDVQRAAKIADEPGGSSALEAIEKQLTLLPIAPNKRAPTSMFENPLRGLAEEEAVGIPGLRSNVQRR